MGQGLARVLNSTFSVEETQSKTLGAAKKYRLVIDSRVAAGFFFYHFCHSYWDEKRSSETHFSSSKLLMYCKYINAELFSVRVPSLLAFWRRRRQQQLFPILRPGNFFFITRKVSLAKNMKKNIFMNEYNYDNVL